MADAASSQPMVATAENNAAQQMQTQKLANGAISSDEIALYDRQIRLWGVQAQEKIRTANVLLIGLSGLGGETIKNLVLSGIGALTVVDDQLVREEDLGAQFLIQAEDVGKNRAEAARPRIQSLNPRVKIEINTSSVIQLLQNPQFFQQFTIILATDLPVDVLQTINSVCRLCAKPFYAAATYGFYGYIFADLQQHTFVIEREKSNMVTTLGPETATRSIIGATTKKAENGKTTEIVTKSELYSPLKDVTNALLPADRIASRRKKLLITPILSLIKALWAFQIATARPYPDENSRQDLEDFTRLATEWHKTFLLLPPETLKSDTMREFLQGVSTEISPVCSYLGGALAQNVIHVIGQNEQPIQNLMVFDGQEFTSEIYAMHPLTPEMISGMAPVGIAMTGSLTGGMAGMPVNGNGSLNGN